VIFITGRFFGKNCGKLKYRFFDFFKNVKREKSTFWVIRQTVQKFPQIMD
jgi:hypothetical protein